MSPAVHEPDFANIVANLSEAFVQAHALAHAVANTPEVDHVSTGPQIRCSLDDHRSAWESFGIPPKGSRRGTTGADVAVFRRDTPVVTVRHSSREVSSYLERWRRNMRSIFSFVASIDFWFA